MSQQVPPNNSGVPQGNDVVVTGGHADALSGYGSQSVGTAQYGNGGLPPTYGPESYARQRVPMIDPIESAKLMPQLIVLLILSGLKRHWKWSLPLGLILGLLAVGGLYLARPVQHEAVAQLQIRTIRPRLLVEDGPQSKYDDFVNTQLVLLRSPVVISRALEVPEVARLQIITKQKGKGRDWLIHNLRASPISKSEIVRVSIATDDPDASRIIVNAVISAYFTFIDGVARQANQDLTASLRLEETKQLQTTQLLQERIRTKARRATIQGAAAAAAGGEGQLAIGLIPGESLIRDVALADAKLTALRAQLRSTLERMNQPSAVPVGILIGMNPETKNLTEQRERLVQTRENRAIALANPQNDDRIAAWDREIERLDAKITSLTAGADSNSLKEVQNFFRIQEDVKRYQLEQEIQNQVILVEELNNKYLEQVRKSVERTDDVLGASFEQAELDRSNRILDQIHDRILAISTEQKAPDRITKLTPEAVVSAPNYKRQFMIIVGGAAVFACFPLLLSIAIERMKPRLYHVSQVRRAVPQVLIGEIMEPPVSWIHGATFRKRLARYRESVHNWCTHLLLSGPFRSCKTLSIASVAGDDGKTFLAVQIAVAMSQMKAGKVLLIDGDMRVGRLHLLFGNEETGIGLADVLSFRNQPGEAIVQNEKEPNLELLSAGQLDMSPYELLGDGRFRELLDALEQSPSNPSGYSLIIVVLPPIANAAESLIMAASTDSTLLCVRQGETVLAAMEDVYRKLVNTGTAVDGIVVKDIPYYQMAGRDGGFADRLEQIRLSHLLQYAD